MRDEGDWEGMDLWREEEKRAEGRRGLEEQREGGPSSREDARGTKREIFFLSLVEGSSPVRILKVSIYPRSSSFLLSSFFWFEIGSHRTTLARRVVFLSLFSSLFSPPIAQLVQKKESS